MHLIFLAPVFMINAFSTFRLLNQTHLVVLEQTIATKIATIFFSSNVLWLECD